MDLDLLFLILILGAIIRVALSEPGAPPHPPIARWASVLSANAVFWWRTRRGVFISVVKAVANLRPALSKPMRKGLPDSHARAVRKARKE
jgi:hypothetical protein